MSEAAGGHAGPGAAVPPGPGSGSGALSMWFIGVTTGQSAIMRVYPRWAEILGLPAKQMRGVDVPLHSPTAEYRSLVATMRDDATCAGGLVTTHKIDVFEAAGDMFDELDEFARACGEISSISRRDGRLLGHAKDPITAGLSFEELAPADLRNVDVVCLGAGGSSTALTWHLARRDVRPQRIVCTARRAESLERMREVHVAGGLDASLFEYAVVQAGEESDRIVEAAPDGSVIVNATGLGKDRPGSPLTDGVVFPRRAIAWDFNYRGDLGFLRQARAQAQARNLEVVDGWRYFVHGWTRVIAEVFAVPIDRAMVEKLDEAAKEAL